jgi:sugar O-acyltransferase (sialic acid O-acetyltransferase NeuD family)
MGELPPAILCGTGGFAAEVVAEFPGRFVAAYDPFSSEDMFEGLPVARDLRQLVQAGARHAVIAVGDPRLARRVDEELSEVGIALLDPLVSSSATITGSDVELGPGTLIMAGSILTNHIRMGRACVVNINCTIGHHAVLGDYVAVMPITALSGRVTIGDGSYLGSHVFVKEGVRIAPGSVIGATAGVFKDIAVEGKTWIGSPARPVGASDV